MIKWTTERRKISDLIPAEYNPRQASAKEVADLTASIDRFDLADPLVINSNNRVIGGHFRLKILKERGVQEVDVRVPDRELTLHEEQELNLRLNKNIGHWDMDMLANINDEILKCAGFEDNELPGYEPPLSAEGAEMPSDSISVITINCRRSDRESVAKVIGDALAEFQAIVISGKELS